MMKVAAFTDDAGSGRFLRGGGARTETPSAVRGGTVDAVADEDVAQCSERKGTLVAICIASKSINDDEMPPTHATHVETHATRRKQQQRRDASARHRVASSRNSLKASTPHPHIPREKKKGVDARKRGGRELQNKHLVLFVFMLVP